MTGPRAQLHRRVGVGSALLPAGGGHPRKQRLLLGGGGEKLGRGGKEK